MKKLKRFSILLFWGTFLILFQNCAGDNLGKMAAGISSQNSASSGTSLNIPVPVAAPVIQSLTSTQSRVSWVLSGGAPTSLTLNGNNVLGSSFLDVAPTVTTTYTLVATNSAGFMTASTTITVASPSPSPSATPTPSPSPSPSVTPTPTMTKPSITAMSVSPSVITLGSDVTSSTISWTVTGSGPITLKLDSNTVTGSSASVSPTATKSYTLTATNSAGSASASVTITVNPKPKVTVTNPPTTGTTATDIAWTINTTDTSFQVYCRMKKNISGQAPIVYDPSPCQNPWPIGRGTPLPMGDYEIDFYINAAAAADAANPSISYTWVVPAIDPLPSPSPSPSSSPAPTPSGVAMPSMPYPVGTNFEPSQHNPLYYDGDTVTANGYNKTTNTGIDMNDGIVRMARVDDPGGSGRKVYLHRIVRADAHINSGETLLRNNVRAEKVWIDQGIYLFPNHDYWFAFAFRPKMDEWPSPTGLGDDRFLVMQTHSESNGDTQPPLALYMQMDGSAAMVWSSSYSAAPQAQVKQGSTTLKSQALPTNQWYKFVIHIRPGWDSSQSPRLEIWQTTGGSETYTQIVNDSNPNDYNWNTGTYARIGFYKWGNAKGEGTNWSPNFPTIAGYFTTLYMAPSNSSDPLAAGKAALNGL